ncbi:hypothetical protein SAMN04488020_11133 [Palleronia marisminoris]|uniref:Uncharacterized protein n=1 Tax=Palleronia marisminoris TaxID=315423 RepID=A0A1Y5THZ8_9RHOB|nr:hypothetical protein [Palleronia marisminoris]SFH37170.1 hypothetical protein SAMN04488020_11133 [Palleronia marisminoris]SLN62485.1 hypothetical protein PAM7066_03108 [Palleronia marisminoris]
MNDHWFSNPTQIYYACRALARGHTLNHMDVIRGVRGWRLGAIVHTLRSNYGWPILTEYRGPERIGHYYLAKTCDPAKLDYPPSARGLVMELETPHRDDPDNSSNGTGGLDG